MSICIFIIFLPHHRNNNKYFFYLNAINSKNRHYYLITMPAKRKLSTSLKQSLFLISGQLTCFTQCCMAVGSWSDAGFFLRNFLDAPSILSRKQRCAFGSPLQLDRNEMFPESLRKYPNDGVRSYAI